jgi:pimeloyl-ACP methyl ester carboxylesterase
MCNGLWTELNGNFRPPGRIPVPAGAAIFPKEVRAANPPRSWADMQYNIQHWNVMPKGGHFAALEQPDVFLADVQKFFRNYL